MTAAQRSAGDGRRRKALLIGCNYPGTSAKLSGCCNDAVIMEYLLKHKFGYQDIKILRDDGKGGDGKPTRRNIMTHIRWLVGDARAGDSLFFHFSGALSHSRGLSSPISECQAVDHTATGAGDSLFFHFSGERSAALEQRLEHRCLTVRQ